MSVFKAIRRASAVGVRSLLTAMLLGGGIAVAGVMTTPQTVQARPASVAVGLVTGGSMATASAAAFDVTPPPPPVIAQPVSGALIGNVPLVFTGTAEPDATILVFLDGAIITTFADGAGNWTTASTVFVGSDAVHDAYAMAFDAAGNTSDFSPTITFTVDPVAPDAPIITTPADGSTTDDPMPTLSGTAEAGATVHLTIDGAAPETVPVSAGGAWSYTPPSPLSVGLHTLAAVAVDPAGNASSTSAAVRFSYSPMTIVTTSLPNGRVGGGYVAGLVVTGGTGPYSWAVTAGSLPGGLALSDAGVISGTPAASGGYAFTVAATDASGLSTHRAYTVSVAAPASPTAGPRTVYIPASSSGGATTINLSSQVANATAIELVSPPDRGAIAITGLSAIYEPAPGFFGEVTFSYRAIGFADGGAGAVSAPATVTIILTSPTLALAGGAQPNGRIGAVYSRTLAATGGTAPYAYSVTAGALPTGMALARYGTLSGAPTASGVFGFTVTATDSSTGAGPFNVSAVHELTIDAPTIGVTPATLLNAVVAQAYSHTFSATGGVAPYRYTVTGGTLPVGLILSPSGGLSGTPTEGGAFNFTVSATDASTGAGPYTASQAIDLTVSGSAIAISPPALPSATRGAAYSQAVTASGGVAPYVYAISSGVLPAGLTLSTAGQISGAPTVTGSFAFQVRATDSAGGAGPYSGTTDLILTVEAASVTVTPTTLPKVLAGMPYSQQMQAVGGQGGYSFTITAGTLPQGLALSAAGLLSGRPATAGSFAFTVTAADRFDNTGSAAVTLEVTGRPDPSADPDVRGLNTAQAEATRRLAGTQMSNFSRRLEALHHQGEGQRSSAMDLRLDAHAFTPLDETQRAMGDLSQVLGRSQGLGLAGMRDRSGRDEMERMITARRTKEPGDASLDETAAKRASANVDGGATGPSIVPRIWAGGAISLGERDATTRTAEMSVTTSGVSVGVDVSAGDTLDLGVGVGFGQESADIGVDVSRMKAESWTGVAYGSWRPADVLYVDGLLGYGRLSFDLRRRAPVNGDLVFGDRDGTVWFGSFAAGADRRFGAALIVGYSRLEVVDAHLDAFSETGSALWALRYEARSVTSLQGTMGLRYEREVRRGHDRWTSGGRLELRHEFADADAQGLRYADWLDGPGYSISQEGWGRTQLNLGLSLGFEGRDGLSWSGEYEGGFSKDETLTSFRVRLAKRF